MRLDFYKIRSLLGTLALIGAFTTFLVFTAIIIPSNEASRQQSRQQHEDLIKAVQFMTENCLNQGAD